MPELDFAFLCEYARTDRGMAHVIGAGLDTITVPETPTGTNFGLLLRVTFTRAETGRPHRVEVIIQDLDGERHAQLGGTIEPDWTEGLPVSWRQGALLAFNMGIPLPRFGEYEVVVMIGDHQAKSVPFRVVPPPQATPG